MGGVQFAVPVLHLKVGTPEPITYSFVNPGVHPFSPLRSSVESDEKRLSLQRSSVKFPLEPAGACFEWGQTFLGAEEARVNAMCSICREKGC